MDGNCRDVSRRRVPEPKAKGLGHIVFSVESLEEVMKDLKCEEIRTDWFVRSFTFIKDPNGQPIEPTDGKPDIRAVKYNTEDKWVQEYKEQFGIELSFV